MGDKKVKQIYDNMSKVYDKARVMDYYNKTLETITNLIKKKNIDILDIGCGTGMYSIELSKLGHKVIATDFSEEMINKAKLNSKINNEKCLFLVHDAENHLPRKFSKKQFDLIIFNSSWEFIPKPVKALENLKNHLKKYGLILIITPNPLVSPMIIVAEKLKIKKLSPAFYFFNSFKYRIKKYSKSAGLNMKYYGYKYKFLDAIAIIKNDNEKI